MTQVEIGNTTPTPETDTYALECYAAWLFYERRLLCRQLYPHLGTNADKFVTGGNAGYDWHFKGWTDEEEAYRRDAASRAKAVLDLSGVDWRTPRPQDPDLVSMVQSPDTMAALAAKASGPRHDAEIIEIGRQHAALQAEIDAAPDDMSEAAYNALTERLCALEMAAAALPVATVAGLAVLARMTRTWVAAQMPGGCHADEMAQALFSRIEAMATRAV
jgi:hypothetical protein